MRLVAPVFQLYRMLDDDLVWWRMISPNGRGIARTVAPFSTPGSARASIAQVVGSVDQLSASLRVTEAYRWRWVLHLDGTPMVQGVADQDRRVRCVHAWRNFALLAPLAEVDPTTFAFRGGTKSVVRAPLVRTPLVSGRA
ncbi:hypothetical protein [Pengzhenrongella phosphoraccumulans]|jgi:hypothetical protein|uniref:hypothetical protein n=1 Tax=Pengzhenrongella phosphoraccumulans TaxID=3114394 RepID=UPI00388E96BD